MKTFLFNIVLYGFLGWVLERVINLVFLGYWLDNRVLHLPVQPMYGLGVALTILVWSRLKRRAMPFWLRFIALVPCAIVFTAMSELFSGHMHERLFGVVLWDYRDTFTLWCEQPYSCIIPTGLFGVLAAAVSVFLHPFVTAWLIAIPSGLRRMLGFAFVIAVSADFFITYTRPFLQWIGGI